MKRRAFLQAFALAGAALAGGAVMPPRYLRGVAQLVAGGLTRAPAPAALFPLLVTKDLAVESLLVQSERSGEFDDDRLAWITDHDWQGIARQVLQGKLVEVPEGFGITLLRPGAPC